MKKFFRSNMLREPNREATGSGSTPQPTFNQFLDRVKSEIGLEDLNKRMAELKAANETLVTEKTALAEAVNEMRQRLARRETVTTDSGLHIMRNGAVRIEVSRECGQHVVDVLKKRVLSGGTDAEGGYLIQPEYADEIIRLIPTVGIARRLARIVPMNKDEINFGTLASGVTVYWPSENAAITPSYPAFGQLKLTAKILAALSYAPETLLDDASPEVGQFLVDLFIEAIAAEEDRVFLAGDVSGASDAYNGLLFASGVVSKALAATKTHISDVTSDDLLDLQTTVPDGARENCVYVMSPTVFDFVRKLKDTTGNYIWQPPTAGAPGTIWGKPYELSEKMPAYSTSVQVSKSFVIYGNLKKFAMMGDRKQISVANSNVAGDTFKQIQTAYRVHERIGFNVYGAAIAKLVTAAA